MPITVAVPGNPRQEKSRKKPQRACRERVAAAACDPQRIVSGMITCAPRAWSTPQTVWTGSGGDCATPTREPRRIPRPVSAALDMSHLGDLLAAALFDDDRQGRFGF